MQSMPGMRILFLVMAFGLLAASSDARTLHVDIGFGSEAGDGSVDAPWHSIQHGVSHLQPGDILIIHPGLYAESVSLAVAGTADHPIAIRGEPGVILESPNPLASLSAFDIGGDCRHLEIAGFEARGGYHEALFVRPGASHIAIRDCEIHSNRAGIWISGATAIEVDGCDIHDNAASGVRIFGQSSDVVVRNTASRNNDDGFACLGDADGFTVEDSVSDVTFDGCVAQGNGEDGFDIQGADATITGSQSLSNGCAGIKLASNATIHATLIAGNQTGLTATSRGGSTRTLAVLNTTIADNSGTQIHLRNPATEYAAGAVFEVSLRNVIASGEGKALEVGPGIQVLEDHNIFYRPGTTDGLIVVHQPDGDPLRYSGQKINAGLWAAQGGGTATWAIDPGFEAAGNYRHHPSSPAIDSGAPISTADADLAGTVRPLGNGVDRGAYESPYTRENHLPWPDPGPSREVALGGRITFHAYGSFDPDGDPLTFTWYFGDVGSTLTGYSAAHRFNQPGLHEVSLTAADGTSSQTRTAQVLLVIDPLDSITPATACPAAPQSGCIEGARSVVRQIDRAPSGPSNRDRFLWKWLRGPAMDPNEWGSPLVGATTYRLCVYDDDGLQVAVDIPSPAECSHPRCWRQTDRGFLFGGANSDGVTALKLIASATRPVSKFILSTRGPSTFVDTSTPLVVQLLRSDAAIPCWQSRVEAL